MEFEEINIQYDVAKIKFPRLNPPVKVDWGWEISGAIDVIDDEGSLWDTFEVNIIIPKEFPESLLQLNETRNRIPKESKWHNSNSCCLSTNAIIYSTLGEDINLLNWLVKFAHPFLANFIFKMKTGDYANGEFEHFTGGIIQGYEKLFGINGKEQVLARLQVLCSVINLERNDKCFCGSGKKFKKCYLRSPFTHRYSGIPYDLLKRDLVEIRCQKRL